MTVDVVLLPKDLQRAHLQDRLVVVFDVLRATTTMAAALAAGVREIRVFGDLEAARAAAGGDVRARLLCGEQNCLPPPGFDLGNSPGAFSRELHARRTVYMCTTNGTRAIVAARDAAVVLTGALVNASPVGRAIVTQWPNLDVTLLCAGTGGAVAMEDVIGAGAVIDALQRLTRITFSSDVASIAHRLFQWTRGDLRSAVADTLGGRNVIAAGLEPDIDFAARLDSLDVVGVVAKGPLSVRPVDSD
jgi:2-phosphosulfolactate phosphatase